MMYRKVKAIGFKEGKLCVTVDKKDYFAAELAAEINLTVPSIHSASKRNTLSEFEEWFNSAIVKTKNKLYRTTTIVWREHEPCWLSAIVEHTGISSQSAGSRLVRWSKGKMDTDTLFKHPDLIHNNNSNNKEFKIDISNSHTSIVVEHVMGNWNVSINDTPYTTKEAAEELNISLMTFRSLLIRLRENPEELQEQLNRIAWKYDNRINMKDKVYVRYDGAALAVATVRNEVRNMTNEGIRKRLQRWVVGIYSTKDVYAVDLIDDNKRLIPDLSHVKSGDLAHLSNKKKHCPTFIPGKYDEILQGHNVGKINTQTANVSK